MIKDSEIPTFEDWFGENEHKLYWKTMEQKEVARVTWHYVWRMATELLEEIS